MDRLRFWASGIRRLHKRQIQLQTCLRAVQIDTVVRIMRRRIDDYPGSIEEYVKYLEDTLIDLRSRFPAVARPASTLEADGRIQDQGHDQAQASPNKRPRQLEIVQWEPASVDHRPAKARTSNNAPWRRLAQTLVQETPFANNWASTLRDNGVHEMMSTGQAVTVLLGPEHEINTSPTQDRLPPIDDEQGAFARVRAYARAAAQKGLDASAALMLANFQKFLVFCLCSVMRETGVPENDVNGIMRICLGNVTKDYCRRVLRAAVYLNQLVDALYMEGWGLRASELLLLCKDLLQSTRLTK